MSIILHHYKTLTDKLSTWSNVVGHIENINEINDDDNEYNINNRSIILSQELDKWNNYSLVLRKQNRELFQETLLLQSSYKYSSAIDIKGEQYSTEVLILSLIFEQRKLIKKKKLIKNPTRQSWLLFI